MSIISIKMAYEWLLNFLTWLQGVGNTLAAEISKRISQPDPVILKTVMARFPSGRTGHPSTESRFPNGSQKSVRTASTRLKYYYQAQKRYVKETGKPAYS